ncbi:hypothetical protein A0H81_03080 [Grifola frondosa]|uniref:Arrestin-like N-terminal domain-containing protein n=1 Tax=Grifola frondosa TaxID=5627 RepID=A0A1C7MM14_GRIFR|nr:hypothetical protein A0H81_03080 [Grifola frondosa]
MSAGSELPRYERAISNSNISPRASGPTSPVEHRYQLLNSKGRPWLILKVLSNAPTPNNLPNFFEGDAINGTVELNLEREDTAKSISITVTGQLTSSVTDVHNFLNVSQVLWSASSEDNTPPNLKRSGKLRGMHSWSYSFFLPKECSFKSHVFPYLPRFRSAWQGYTSNTKWWPLFIVEGSGLTVQLELSSGTYRSYAQRRLRWHDKSPPIKIRGSVFNTRAVDATCTLALAKPLCYTRGSVVPCLMTIKTADPQALDLLAAPRSMLVRLRRHISMGEVSAVGIKSSGVEFETATQDVSTATWWSYKEGGEPLSQKRVLHGEIPLASALKPSCNLGRFQLSYTVAVYPPKAVAFAPDDSSDNILQRKTVTIATAYPTGPRPRIYSPPGYDDASSAGASDFVFSFREHHKITISRPVVARGLRIHRCIGEL